MGRHIAWKGNGDSVEGFDAAIGRVMVKVDRRYFRPTEVDALLGDASKARRELGWYPETSFADLVAEMVKSDLEAGRRRKRPQAGRRLLRSCSG